jgi:hypothetical protein
MKMYDLYKPFVLSVFLLAAMQFVNLASAQSDALSVANLGVSPQPIIAGQNMTLQFQLYNSYTNELTNVNLGLYGSYPILNQSPTDTQVLSNIPTGLYGGTQFLFYHLHIPKSTKSGTYTIDAVANYQTVGQNSQYVSGTSTMPISFYVQGIPDIQLTANPSSAVIPGSQLSVTIDALNSGTDNATEVSLSISNSRNFSVIGASNFALGTISPQQTAAASAILQPNSTLSEGNASIPVTLKYNTEYGNSVTQFILVPVSIFVSTPDISVSVESATPASIYPGSNQTLTLSIQNIGAGLAKNLTIYLKGTNNITVGNSASNIFIGSLAAGASTTHSVLITAGKNDNLSAYQLPAYLSYQTANYQGQVNRTEFIPISLQPSAIFNITGIYENLNPSSTYAPITLKVKNTGNEDAQNIVFSLQTIYPISQVNPNAYLEQLAPGQSANITFYVNVDAQASQGQYPITLYDQWTQQNGAQQIYTRSQNYYAAVATPSGTGYLPIIIVVVAIAATVMIYRMVKKSSAQKKDKK